MWQTFIVILLIVSKAVFSSKIMPRQRCVVTVCKVAFCIVDEGMQPLTLGALDATAFTPWMERLKNVERVSAKYDDFISTTTPIREGIWLIRETGVQ